MRLFKSRGDRADRNGAARSNGDEQGALAELDELMRRNREERDPKREQRIVRLRHEAFRELGAKTSSPAAPASAAPTTAQSIPVISPEGLRPEVVRRAILSHGCVHVPGLLSRSRAQQLATGIDRTFAACDARGGDAGVGDEHGWYQPFKPLPGYKLGGGRRWNREGGAIWAADSPRLMFELLDTFEGLGLRELVGGYLGERPALSMNKSVLRRVSPKTSGADWHQDGAFLGAEIRSLNVWLTLSHCGRDAPGMDVVPRRLEEIVETGTEGANFNWSVSPEVVDRVAGDTGVTRPIFEPGDALLFDHLLLHRTASDPQMAKDRYAIETWFFGPSAYPEQQVPLVL